MIQSNKDDITNANKIHDESYNGWATICSGLLLTIPCIIIFGITAMCGYFALGYDYVGYRNIVMMKVFAMIVFVLFLIASIALIIGYIVCCINGCMSKRSQINNNDLESQRLVS